MYVTIVVRKYKRTEENEIPNKTTAQQRHKVERTNLSLVIDSLSRRG